MKKKDENWHDKEIKKLKDDKKEQLGKLSDNDDKGTASDVRLRKTITEDFKKKRRSIKRSEKQNWKNELKKKL